MPQNKRADAASSSARRLRCLDAIMLDCRRRMRGGGGEAEGNGGMECLLARALRTSRERHAKMLKFALT